MANPAENKKKVRGYKRRIKQIEYWKQRNLPLDMDNFISVERDYVKIWIDPWNRLHKRNPPVWMKRIIFTALMEIYHNWRGSLQGIDEPFYLALWLAEPRFYDSQVVAAKGSYIEYYNNLFTISPQKIPVPAIYAQKAGSISNWDTYLDEDYYYLAGDELTEKELHRIIRKSHKISSAGNDKCYTVPAGYRWVGR